jgi:hypothetical protein
MITELPDVETPIPYFLEGSRPIRYERITPMRARVRNRNRADGKLWLPVAECDLPGVPEVDSIPAPTSPTHMRRRMVEETDEDDSEISREKEDDDMAKTKSDKPKVAKTRTIKPKAGPARFKFEGISLCNMMVHLGRTKGGISKKRVAKVIKFAGFEETTPQTMAIYVGSPKNGFDDLTIAQRKAYSELTGSQKSAYRKLLESVPETEDLDKPERTAKPKAEKTGKPKKKKSKAKVEPDHTDDEAESAGGDNAGASEDDADEEITDADREAAMAEA